MHRMQSKIYVVVAGDETCLVYNGKIGLDSVISHNTTESDIKRQERTFEIVKTKIKNWNNKNMGNGEKTAIIMIIIFSLSVHYEKI